MYNLCGSEVVAVDRHHAALAVDPADSVLGRVAVPPTGSPIRDHLAPARLRHGPSRDPLLVRDLDASVVALADPPVGSPAGAPPCPCD